VIGEHDGMLDRLPADVDRDNFYIHMWFAKTNYPMVTPHLHTPGKVYVLVACGDPSATQTLDLVVDVRCTYVGFACMSMSVMQGIDLWDSVYELIYARKFIMGMDFSFFMLPPDMQIAMHRLEASLCDHRGRALLGTCGGTT
jgi:hypothetical protein